MFKNMIQITLDNDVNNLPRIAIFKELVWNTENKTIKLKSIYGVYQNDEFTYGHKMLEQTASNATWVDSKTGEYCDETNPDKIGEYDFFMELIKNPINISALIQSYMTKAKNTGRYI